MRLLKELVFLLSMLYIQMSRTFQQVTLARLYLTAPHCPDSTCTTTEQSYCTLGLANSVINGKTDRGKRHSGTQIPQNLHPITYAAHKTCPLFHSHFLRSSLLVTG